jgi:hypothetical protein
MYPRLRVFLYTFYDDVGLSYADFVAWLEQMAASRKFNAVEIDTVGGAIVFDG